MSQYFSSKNVPDTRVILMLRLAIVSGHMIKMVMYDQLKCFYNELSYRFLKLVIYIVPRIIH